MENITLDSLLSKYLAWCAIHRSPRSLEWYSGHIEGFRKHIGANAQMGVMELRAYHISEWIDSHPKWGDTYKAGAIIAIKRVYNWAIELGYIENSPIVRMKKPTAKRREIYMVAADFEQIMELLRPNDPFRTLFQFVWITGCRPQEVRHIEARHIDIENERIIFPVEESKGKRKRRIIYLHGESLEIIKRLLPLETNGGKLFKNNRGSAWTKYAICNRFHRISKVLGKRMFCYAARHGFGTRKLIQGHDHLTVAALMGHRDGSMLATIYSHIDQDITHLRKALAD